MGTPWRRLAVAMGACLVAVSGAAVQGIDEADAPRVLFVGNSLTYTYDVPEQVEGLAASADPPEPMEVSDLTMGGATLGKLILARAPDRIRDGEYDIVVLQGDIPETYSETTDAFVEAATTLHEAARDSGARTVMYMTWPYERLDFFDLDDIMDAHRHLEAELGVAVAPVGLAFERAHAERPDLAMLGPDREHQSADGAYLAAATIYATIEGRSPVGLPYRYRFASDDTAEFLQRIAWETVMEWNGGLPAD